MSKLFIGLELNAASKSASHPRQQGFGAIAESHFDFEGLMVGVEKETQAKVHREGEERSDVDYEFSTKLRFSDHQLLNRDDEKSEILESLKTTCLGVETFEVDSKCDVTTTCPAQLLVLMDIAQNFSPQIADQISEGGLKDEIRTNGEVECDHRPALSGEIHKVSDDDQVRNHVKDYGGAEMLMSAVDKTDHFKRLFKGTSEKSRSIVEEIMHAAPVARDQISVKIDALHNHFNFQTLATGLSSKIAQSLPPISSEQPATPSQIGLKLHAAQTKMLHITLHPESLGAISVAMCLKGKILELKIETSVRETAAALSNDQKMLEHLVRSSGYDVADSAITISFKPDSLGPSSPANQSGQPADLKFDQNQTQFSRMDFSSSSGGGSMAHREHKNEKMFPQLFSSPGSVYDKITDERNRGAVYL